MNKSSFMILTMAYLILSGCASTPTGTELASNYKYVGDLIDDKFPEDSWVSISSGPKGPIINPFNGSNVFSPRMLLNRFCQSKHNGELKKVKNTSFIPGNPDDVNNYLGRFACYTDDLEEWVVEINAKAMYRSRYYGFYVSVKEINIAEHVFDI